MEQTSETSWAASQVREVSNLRDGIRCYRYNSAIDILENNLDKVMQAIRGIPRHDRVLIREFGAALVQGAWQDEHGFFLKLRRSNFYAVDKEDPCYEFIDELVAKLSPKRVEIVRDMSETEVHLQHVEVLVILDSHSIGD